MKNLLKAWGKLEITFKILIAFFVIYFISYTFK